MHIASLAISSKEFFKKNFFFPLTAGVKVLIQECPPVTSEIKMRSLGLWFFLPEQHYLGLTFLLQLQVFRIAYVPLILPYLISIDTDTSFDVTSCRAERTARTAIGV
jgi:hypothetical protein